MDNNIRQPLLRKESDRLDSKKSKFNILKEPSVKIEIPSLEKENQELDEKGILQKPKEIYLDYC